MSAPVSNPASRTVSITEAARLSGRSDKTIRRWIKAGRLRATRAEGGYRVDVEDLSTLSRTGSTPDLDVGVDGEQEDVQPATAMGVDIMRAEAMAAYTRSILEPLVARMAEQDGVIRDQAEMIGRQAERVAGLERDIGELRAENRALVARTAPQSVEPTTEPPTARWRALAPWLLGLLAIVVAVGLVAVR